MAGNAAFIVSGLFHEYMWSIFRYNAGFRPGQVTLFFLYQAMVPDSYGTDFTLSSLGLKASLRKWIYTVKSTLDAPIVSSPEVFWGP